MSNLVKLEEQKNTETKYFDRLSVSVTNIALLRSMPSETKSKYRWELLNFKSLVSAFENHLNRFGASEHFEDNCIHNHYMFNNCEFHFHFRNGRYSCIKASFLGVNDVV